MHIYIFNLDIHILYCITIKLYNDSQTLLMLLKSNVKHNFPLTERFAILLFKPATRVSCF